MFKNALISVSDKTGLAEFVKPLVAEGLRIVSSGGTAKYLEDAGIAVTRVSEQTQFPEVMGGRVKTLHPYIHMPLLYRDQQEDRDILKEHNLPPFDLVIVNLYPFGQGLEQGKDFNAMVELIDIGGPTLMRAAAKNFQAITVVADPADYNAILKNGEVNLATRQKLAAKVFAHVSGYDQKIANYLSAEGRSQNSESTEDVFSVKGQSVNTLRYGENPQQSGSWYKTEEQGLHKAEIIQGKPLSYNNLVDLDGACRTVTQFDAPTVVSVKHNNPCGVASADTIHQALEKSLRADPVSVFGGIISSNQTLDGACAESLSKLFLECVIAPDYTADALATFEKKKNLRILKWPSLAEGKVPPSKSFRSLWGGVLLQSTDRVEETPDTWTVHGRPPSSDEVRELMFAWRVCASLKSNAIAITGGQQSLGLGMGQVNRVDAVRQAIGRAKEFHGTVSNWVLASDAFFPFADSITVAAEAGIQWIIQPGGSVRDEEVIAMAKEKNVNMIFTGKRHFLH